MTLSALKKTHPELFPYLEKIAAIAERHRQRLFQQDKKGKAYGQVLTTLPEITPSTLGLDRDWVRVGGAQDLNPHERDHIEAALRALMPWRKGPFEIFGIDLRSEWDSSLKWRRLKDHIADLSGRRILDIGSSSGYYLFRMAAHQPALAIGIEPYPTYYCQFLALQHYIQAQNICCFPLKIEEMPVMEGFFDTIFCMGILYHCRSPLDALMDIRRQMRKEGELVLETLVIPGDDHMALFPEKRYAKMRNVFFLPTVNCLCKWLERSGFHNIRCIDVTRTTFDEQRKTPWIQSESLESFLDPEDHLKTIEGYPAPTRAIVLANARL